jgi:hypothetical protein
MAIPTHVAIIGQVQVPNDGSGDIKIKGNSSNFTLGDAKTHTREMRVLENLPDIPNSAGNPTIKDYIELEGASDFQLMHLDQTYIITQTLP